MTTIKGALTIPAELVAPMVTILASHRKGAQREIEVIDQVLALADKAVAAQLLERQPPAPLPEQDKPRTRRRPKTYYSTEQKKAIVAEYQAGDVMAIDLAAKYKINKSCIFAWARGEDLGRSHSAPRQQDIVREEPPGVPPRQLIARTVERVRAAVERRAGMYPSPGEEDEPKEEDSQYFELAPLKVTPKGQRSRSFYTKAVEAAMVAPKGTAVEAPLFSDVGNAQGAILSLIQRRNLPLRVFRRNNRMYICREEDADEAMAR